MDKMIERPTFKALSIILNILLPISICGGIASCFFWLNNILYQLFIFLALIIVYIIFRLKTILIFLVRLYQRFAPYEIRQLCVFYPSCSEYMILCLKKYGIIKGLYRGTKRIARCKPPNGGYDPPDFEKFYFDKHKKQ